MFSVCCQNFLTIYNIVLMNRLRRYLIWLLRCGYCRGFGIQSPTDYAFVRYVINEHYPYYSYSDLKTKYPSLSIDDRKLMELYFRISNWLQPEYAVIHSDRQKVVRNYVTCGCFGTKVLPVDIFEDLNLKAFLAIFGMNANYDDFTQILTMVNEKSAIVVEDIYGSNKRIWKTMGADVKATVCFDLYYAGIATFDKTRYKTNYKINF